MAGGITDKGSLDDINQAREIKNGECIIVRSIDDEGVLDTQYEIHSLYHQ